MIYCPGHNGVCENEIADSLAKTGAEKARHLPCEMTATKEEIKKVNKKLTLQKWGRRWQNTKSNMYKILIPNLTSDGLKQRALHLSFTTRNGASKIVRLKSSHCLLNYHKSKSDTETKPNCQECNSKETPIHLLFDCNKFENERQKLKKIIESILNKNKISWHSIRAEELLGEHQLKPEDAKKVRLEVLKFLSNTEKDI